MLAGVAWRGALAIVTTTGDLRSLTEPSVARGFEVTALTPTRLRSGRVSAETQDLVRVRKAQPWCGWGLISISGSTGCWRRLQAASAGASGYVDASFGVATLDVRGLSIGGDGTRRQRQSTLLARSAQCRDHHCQYPGRACKHRSCNAEPTRPTGLPSSRASTAMKNWDERLAALRGIPLVAYHNCWPYLRAVFDWSSSGRWSRSRACHRRRPIWRR